MRNRRDSSQVAVNGAKGNCQLASREIELALTSKSKSDRWKGRGRRHAEGRQVPYFEWSEARPSLPVFEECTGREQTRWKSHKRNAKSHERGRR